MGEDCISPQLGVHFISEECQRSKAVRQGHEDGPEILCLLLFPHHRLDSWGDRDPGSLGTKKPEDHRVCRKINYPPWGHVSSILSGQALEAFQLCRVIRKVQKLKSVVTNSTLSNTLTQCKAYYCQAQLKTAQRRSD